MKKSVKIYTLGCKTNQYETEAIREGLESSGFYTEADASSRADIYIVNTCTVTAKADRDSRWIIRRCNRESPSARIVVTGCLVGTDGEAVRKLPGVSHIVKNSRKHRMLDILEGKPHEGEDEDRDAFLPLKIEDFKYRTKAFIKIQDGCDNICSYCKIPHVRGRSRSRDAHDILEEAKRLIGKGFSELILTGICLGDWKGGVNREIRLPGLLEMLESIDKDFRIRLSSIEPKMVSDKLIRTIARSKKICPHLAIPLQSGSDRILALMNRPYTASCYMKLIKKIRKEMPDASITTDVMIGFPGESEKDFKKTVKVIRNILPSRLHIFAYSRREGTLAARYRCDCDPSSIKRKRSILERVSTAASYKYRRRFLSRTVEGLVETRRDPQTKMLTGYTERYIKFFLDGPDSLMGKIIPVKVRNVDIKSTYCVY